MAQLL